MSSGTGEWSIIAIYNGMQWPQATGITVILIIVLVHECNVLSGACSCCYGGDFALYVMLKPCTPYNAHMCP